MNTLDKEIMQMLVDLTNNTRHDTAQEIKQILAESQVVFGVWIDAKEPSGFCYIILKGARVIKEITATGIATTMKIAAIPCIEPEHAVAMKVLFGDHDNDA